jgi:AraC-like DNA-binding protein
VTDPLDLEPATIPVRYAREALARLGVAAAERTHILRAAGIAPGLVRAGGGRLTGSQFARLHRRAVAASGDESLGYAEHRTPVGSFAFLVRSLTRCPDVAACLEQASAFYRLFDPRGGWEVDVAPATTTIRLCASGRAQAGSLFHVHGMLLTPSRTAAWLTGRSLPLGAVVLPERFRAFAAETRFLFGVAPTFGDEAAIRFPTRQLAVPVIRGPADADSYLRQSLRGFLLGAAGDDVEHRVRQALAESVPFASAGVDEVARRLAMSRQTLARHLQRIGTSFALLRDELRRDFAIGLLGRGLRVAAVSERLGYSEPSAFHRAFRAWTGSAPGRYARARSAASTSASVL